MTQCPLPSDHAASLQQAVEKVRSGAGLDMIHSFPEAMRGSAKRSGSLFSMWIWSRVFGAIIR